MKKKKLLRKIIELQELNDCLFSTITALRIQLWGKCTPEQAKGTILERTKEPESKEQNDKRREILTQDLFDKRVSGIWNSQSKTEPIERKEDYLYTDRNGKLVSRPLKTEGHESESELKENTISLEVGKEYMTKNGYKLICKEIDEYSIPEQMYVLYFTNSVGQLHYSKEGVICTGQHDWDILSEVKE